MTAAKPLGYAGRCERYARQRGWHYDEHELSIRHLTPRQRRRAMHKEQRQYRDAPAVVRARRQRARQAEQRAAAQRRRHAAGWGDYDYGEPFDGAFYEADGFDYYDPHDLGYCVTPGCNCCGAY